MSGRLVCDTYLASKDLIRSKSYRLSDLAQSQLKIVREDIEFDKITKYYENAQSLLHMVKHCSFDAFLSTALMFKLQILPLTKQLTNLAGNLWSRTMTGARAERNEFLLLHEFHRQKYICPDKAQFGKSQAAVIEAIELDQDEGTRYETTKAKKMKLMREKKNQRQNKYRHANPRVRAGNLHTPAVWSWSQRRAFTTNMCCCSISTVCIHLLSKNTMYALQPWNDKSK